MTTTDSRQLRMLIDGILEAYGVSDNLELSIRLCEAVKQFIASPTPAHAREQILAGLRKRIVAGSAIRERLNAIADEINQRAIIRPTTEEWQEFIKWAYRQEREKGETITKFLDWWVSDEWRLHHPPSRPESWYVKWDQAFKTPAANQAPRPELRPVTARAETPLRTAPPEKPVVLKTSRVQA